MESTYQIWNIGIELQRTGWTETWFYTVTSLSCTTERQSWKINEGKRDCNRALLRYIYDGLNIFQTSIQSVKWRKSQWVVSSLFREKREREKKKTWLKATTMFIVANRFASVMLEKKKSVGSFSLSLPKELNID
jgi:hypothetical protein